MSSTSRIVPAPNAYNPNTTLVVPQSAKFSIGGGTKGRPLTTSKFQREVPGPGHYPSRSLMGTDSPAKTMSQKLGSSFIKRGDNSPGPGAYTIVTTRTQKNDP